MPYTYLIGWTAHNKWYYGVRYSQKSDDNDLWEKYFTSSSYVRECVQRWGDPDYIKIRRTFRSAELAIKCEARVIRKLKLYERDNFLNKAYSGAIHYDEEVRKKISEAAKRPRSQAFKKARSEAMKKLWEQGVYDNRRNDYRSEEYKAKMSDSLKNTWKTREHHCKGTTRPEEANAKTSITLLEQYANMTSEERKAKHGHHGESNGMYGKAHSSSAKNKIKQAALNRPKFGCEWCNKFVTIQTYSRYHRDGKCLK